MWSFHNRLLLTVTPSSLAVEQDLITESWYGISVLGCRIWRFCLELINIRFDLSEFMDIWLCWHHLSTCDKSLVSEVITTSKDLLCRLQKYQHLTCLIKPVYVGLQFTTYKLVLNWFGLLVLLWWLFCIVLACINICSPISYGFCSLV